MKKITLIILFIFLFITAVIFTSNFLFKNNKLNNIQIDTKSKINFGVINSGDIKSPNINIKRITTTLSNNNPNSLSLDEVSKHNIKNDCYLKINNNVYDVSSYIGYHPAGSKIIVSRCGMEVTGIFSKIHSNRAWDLLKKYKIGIVNSGSGNQDKISQILSAIFDALKKENPNAVIIKVVPKNNFYISEIVLNGKFYEVHIDQNGKIFKEEVESDEFNWLLWQNDTDDK